MILLSFLGKSLKKALFFVAPNLSYVNEITNYNDCVFDS